MGLMSSLSPGFIASLNLTLLMLVGGSPKVLRAQPTSDTPNCTLCHKEITEKWRRSVHVKAASKLPPHERNTLRCRSCHDDAGLRGLITDLLTLRDPKTLRARSKHASSNIDCLTCHGLTPFQTNREPHQVGREVRSLALQSCRRCHELPPLPSRSVACYDPHDLKKLSDSTCETRRSNDHRLKTMPPHGTTTHTSKSE